jgi:CRISPR-associated helicase Cas3
MQAFYSRPENKKGEKEPLWEHLIKTKKLASEFAGAFAGKASELFQKVLRHEEHNVNHAAAGACLLGGYRLLARVIYAHHDGLQWNIKDDLDNSYLGKAENDSVTGKRFAVLGKEQYDTASSYIRENVGIPKDKPVLNKDTVSFYKNLPAMLHCRMLLSCLCDADYTASASHEDENVLKLAKDNTIDAGLVMERLTAYREEIKKRSKADDKLNRLRNEVYDSCVEAAEKRPGMFTLTAPTGTGKTLALLAFAATHAKLYNKRRIIIVLPFLSIISQNAKIYRDICGDVLEAHSMVSYGDDDEMKLLAERWNSPVVVTTSVKFFEAFFRSQPSDLRFLHSITNSVVVFDEAQSIPAELMGTTIETMRALCETFGSTVLFSTATQPAFDIRKDIAFNASEIIADPKRLYDETRRVEVEWDIDESTPLEQIAEKMSGYPSVCCVLNRKDHTHKLFDLLKNYCPEDECFHISTDMCKSHRDKVIKEITERLEKNMPCRLVSTSCIEAGVDLDFKVMYRALAPLDSIVQCAGRCNRNGAGTGRMKVFIPDEDKLYPVKYIENAAVKVKLLISRHPIDICDPEHIREYYTLMLSDRNYDHDKKVLTEAINDHDFKAAEKEYRFIPGAGVNVLVPYEGERQLFDDLSEEARTKGISKAWMRKAAPITVTSYREDKLTELAERCFIYTKHGKEYVPGWYILLGDKFYHNDSGLLFDDDSNLDCLV